MFIRFVLYDFGVLFKDLVDGFAELLLGSFLFSNELTELLLYLVGFL